MKRVLENSIIDTWLKKHHPNAVAKLSATSGVGISTIHSIRSSGLAPKNIETMDKLALALGTKTERLFPLKGDK